MNLRKTPRVTTSVLENCSRYNYAHNYENTELEIPPTLRPKKLTAEKAVSKSEESKVKRHYRNEGNIIYLIRENPNIDNEQSLVDSDSDLVEVYNNSTTENREFTDANLEFEEDHSLVSIRNSICNKINYFLSYKDEWDGEGSCGPKLEVVNEAIQFVTNWSFKSKVPEPELVFHGAVTLVFYDKQGDSKGSIEFQENHLGIYALVDESDKFESGRFNSNSISDVIEVVKKIEGILSYEF